MQNRLHWGLQNFYIFHFEWRVIKDTFYSTTIFGSTGWIYENGYV